MDPAGAADDEWASRPASARTKVILRLLRERDAARALGCSAGACAESRNSAAVGVLLAQERTGSMTNKLAEVIAAVEVASGGDLDLLALRQHLIRHAGESDADLRWRLLMGTDLKPGDVLTPALNAPPVAYETTMRPLRSSHLSVGPDGLVLGMTWPVEPPEIDQAQVHLSAGWEHLPCVTVSDGVVRDGMVTVTHTPRPGLAVVRLGSAATGRPFPARALRPVVQPVGLRIFGDTDG